MSPPQLGGGGVQTTIKQRVLDSSPPEFKGVTCHPFKLRWYGLSGHLRAIALGLHTHTHTAITRQKCFSRPNGLESRGPGIDPFRASGPKWGRKWPKHGFWPHLKNGGIMDRKREKMARKSIFEPFSGHFFHSLGHFSPIFQVRPKSIFRPFSSPFRAGGPKWIYTRSTGFQTKCCKRKLRRAFGSTRCYCCLA